MQHIVSVLRTQIWRDTARNRGPLRVYAQLTLCLRATGRYRYHT